MRGSVPVVLLAALSACSGIFAGNAQVVITTDQFGAGVGIGYGSALAFSQISRPKSYGDYQLQGDSHGSTRFIRHMTVASMIGSAAGVWLAAPRACRAIVPALIGSGLGSLPFMQLENPGAIGTAIVFLLAPPMQSLTGTIAQALAR